MKAFRLFRPVRKPQTESGQAMVEFALTIPMFLSVLLGFAIFGLIFYSYLTVTLAAREGARLLVGDPQQSIANIKQRVRDTSIALDKSATALDVRVEPTDPQQWVSGVQINVTAVYTVPVPSITIPNLRGSNIAIFSPFPVTATSVMTIE